MLTFGEIHPGVTALPVFVLLFVSVVFLFFRLNFKKALV